MGLRQDFDAALEQLKEELIHDLNRTNVLKREKMEALQMEYNQKLVHLQAQFLKRLANSNRKVRVEFDESTARSLTDFGKISLFAAAAGGGTYAALSFITLANPVIATTTVWIFWTTTTTTITHITLATWLAPFLGISASLATTIATGGAAAVVAATVYAFSIPIWKKKIRKKMIQDFDTKILPLLRDWCDDVINKANEAQQA